MLDYRTGSWNDWGRRGNKHWAPLPSSVQCPWHRRDPKCLKIPVFLKKQEVWSVGRSHWLCCRTQHPRSGPVWSHLQNPSSHPMSLLLAAPVWNLTLPSSHLPLPAPSTHRGKDVLGFQGSSMDNVPVQDYQQGRGSPRLTWPRLLSMLLKALGQRDSRGVKVSEGFRDWTKRAWSARNSALFATRNNLSMRLQDWKSSDSISVLPPC